jgi:hypothetical protein
VSILEWRQAPERAVGPGHVLGRYRRASAPRPWRSYGPSAVDARSGVLLVLAVPDDRRHGIERELAGFALGRDHAPALAREVIGIFIGRVLHERLRAARHCVGPGRVRERVTGLAMLERGPRGVRAGKEELQVVHDGGYRAFAA